jgi:hypothetical protein
VKSNIEDLFCDNYDRTVEIYLYNNEKKGKKTSVQFWLSEKSRRANFVVEFVDDEDYLY